MLFTINIWFIIGSAMVRAGDSGSARFWPDLASQCTTALNILNAVNVTYKMPNTDTCCWNGDSSNPVGDFPAAGTDETGVFIGCSVDAQNRQFVSAIQINSDKDCYSTYWPSFSGLPGLSVLTIKHCFMSGVWVDWPNLLTQATELHVLSLAGNGFVGNIPNTITLFKNLKYLDLSHNYFSDVIPASVYDMGQLEHLYLNGNMLTGIIPWGVGQLRSLISLDLSSNYMVGPLPDMRSMNRLQVCSIPLDICVVNYEDVPSICSLNLPLCSAVASSNGNGWFPGVHTNMATPGSKGTPVGVSMGIGIGAGVIVTLALGVFLLMMQKKADKRSNLQPEAKETPRQWYQFDDMDNKPPSSRDDPDITPQTSTEAIPELVIED